ncbi:MAG: sensor histidine kinase, partial [Acidobacteria bacterium]|nr:sensor histidine kinase [Acidobacteriota bacterium]
AVFPFVIWGSLRFGQRGAASVTLIAALLAILGTTHGTGPLTVQSLAESLIRWWAFTTVCALTGLLLAASGAERRRAEAALRQAREKLEQRVEERTRDLTRINQKLQQEMAARKRLEREIIRISEEEQKRIGQELHDGLGQHLTGVALLSRALVQKLGAESPPESDAVQEILQLVNQAIGTTQSLAGGLYPVVLDTGGIVSALEQLAVHTRRLYGIECDFRRDSAPGITDPLVRINLYRIAQEAIHNAVKHGKASTIEIELSAKEGRYLLSIRNDGVGFEPRVLEQSRGLGQHIMRYRASLIGGSLAFHKNPKGGTLVTVFVS